MQEKYPTSPDGNKTYGMYLYTTKGYDHITSVFNVIGHSSSYLSYGIEVDLFEEELNYCLEDDSAFKYALSFMNKMYREGLIDPDSMTTERTAQHKKIEAGGALAGWSAVPGWENAGYYPVCFDELETAYSVANDYGSSVFTCVNSKSKNLDAAIDFVNLLADPEVQRTMVNGPQGEMWDVDASGKVYVTDKGLDWWVNQKEAVFENGETYSLFNSSYFWGKGNTAVDGQVLAMEFADEVLAAKEDSEMNQRWQKTTGYDNYIQLITEKASFIPKSFLDNAGKFTATVPDDMKLIANAVYASLGNNIWKMIYAESDDQFEKIWDECVTECEGLGIKELFDYRVKDLNAAIEKKNALEK